MAEESTLRFKSIFGAYAENISVTAKGLEAREQQPLFREFLDYGIPTVQLTASTIIGSDSVAAAASVVEIEALHPLRGRIAPARLDQEIPAIKVKRSLTQKQYREFLALQNIPGIADARKRQILGYIYNDTKYVVDAVDNRIEYMFLQGLSNGAMVIDTNNNPDGVVGTEAVALGMPEGNIVTNPKALSDATATPVTYINNLISAASTNGKNFAQILLSPSLWNKLKVNKEFMDEMKAYYNPGSNSRQVFTFDAFNDYMAANRFPQFRLIDKGVKIQTDGNKETFHRPFNEDNMVFVPAGKLGVVHTALSMEEMEPQENVDYGTYNRTLVSKWQTRHPWAEYTAAETISMPGFEAIEDIYIMKTNG